MSTVSTATPQRPSWWNVKGHSMALVESDEPPERYLTLANSEGAVLRITPDGNAPLRCRIGWKLVHPDGKTGGFFQFYRGFLPNIFGLDDPELSQWAGGAGQHHYLRLGPYLNIPEPGSGADGNPNLSVFVTPEIQARVALLLRPRRT